MGLVLGLAFLTGAGAAVLAVLFVQEALRLWRRFGRKFAAVFYALLAAACILYVCAALGVVVSIMEFGNFFDLLPKETF